MNQLLSKPQWSSHQSLRCGVVNDLYSDILQSSSYGQDKELNVNQTDDNLQETNPGDLWYDDGSSSENSVEKSHKIDMDREWQKRHDQFHTIGYRDGLIAGKEFAAQEGFNIGFKDSVTTGYSWGLVRGVTSAMACLPIGLKEKLVESEETRNKFQRLHESVKSIPTTDALKLFYEDKKRKSKDQNEIAEPNSSTADSKHQSPEIGVFENYYGQFQSIVSDSPLLDVHLEINQ